MTRLVVEQESVGVGCRGREREAEGMMLLDARRGDWDRAAKQQQSRPGWLPSYGRQAALPGSGSGSRKWRRVGCHRLPPRRFVRYQVLYAA